MSNSLTQNDQDTVVPNTRTLPYTQYFTWRIAISFLFCLYFNIRLSYYIHGRTPIYSVYFMSSGRPTFVYARNLLGQENRTNIGLYMYKTSIIMWRRWRSFEDVTYRPNLPLIWLDSCGIWIFGTRFRGVAMAAWSEGGFQKLQIYVSAMQGHDTLLWLT